MEIRKPEESAASSQLTMSDLWHILKRRKVFIVVFVVLVTVLVALYSLVMPVTYTSSGSLMSPDGDKGGGLSAFLQNATGGLGLGEIGQGGKAGKLVDMLKSRSVAEIAVDKSGITSFGHFKKLTPAQQVEAARDALHFEMNTNGLVLGNCNIKTSYFAGKEEKEQARVLSASLLNAAFAALDSINREKSVSRARQTRQYIERYIVINKKKLDSTQAVLEKFSKENKILALAEQTGAIVDNAVTIGTEISKTEVQLALARAELQAGAPLIAQLQQRLNELRGQYERIQQGGLTANDEFSIPLGRVPEITRTYANLVRDVKILEQINAYLESQRAQESIQEQRDVPMVEVLDAAVPPETRSSPQRAFMVVSALILSTILAAVFVLFREIRRSRAYREIQAV